MNEEGGWVGFHKSWGGLPAVWPSRSVLSSLGRRRGAAAGAAGEGRMEEEE